MERTRHRRSIACDEQHKRSRKNQLKNTIFHVFARKWEKLQEGFISRLTVSQCNGTIGAHRQDMAHSQILTL